MCTCARTCLFIWGVVFIVFRVGERVGFFGGWYFVFEGRKESL